MILVDTSIWIDHLRAGDELLERLLRDKDVLVHPFVIGELAVGNLSPRDTILGMLQILPHVRVATDSEVMVLIDQNQLFGLGIGYIDAHLLAAVQVTAGAALWTRDRRLANVASRLELAVHLPH